MLPPPPVVCLHSNTNADPKGETSAMVVVGFVSQVLGGGGLGVALRVEHQQFNSTAIGAEITGGRGDADQTKLTMIALRGYGRTTWLAHDWTAVTYGVGLSAMNTGMLTLTMHGGAAVSYANGYVDPYLQAGLALAVPLREGDSFGDMDNEVTADINAFEPRPASEHGPVEVRGVRPELFLTIDPGLAVPLGDTGHALSLDFGIAAGLLHDSSVFSLSLADDFGL